MNNYAILLSLFLFLIAGCGSESVSDSQLPNSLEKQRIDYESSLNVWAVHSIKDYEYSISTDWYCNIDSNHKKTVVVRNGLPVDAFDSETGAQDSNFNPESYATIYDLFSDINILISNNANILEVDYDPIYGVPERILYDKKDSIADDERCYLVSDFIQLVD